LNVTLNVINKIFEMKEINGSQIFYRILFLFFFPERKILFKKFDDTLGISEGLLINIIDLFKSIWKSSLSNITCLFVLIHDFVVENRKVQSKTESNWVAGIQRSN